MKDELANIGQIILEFAKDYHSHHQLYDHSVLLGMALKKSASRVQPLIDAAVKNERERIDNLLYDLLPTGSELEVMDFIRAINQLRQSLRPEQEAQG